MGRLAGSRPGPFIRTRDPPTHTFNGRRRLTLASAFPEIKIVEIPGDHHTLFKSDNSAALREAFLTAASDWL